ncbi:AAA family ATPase [Streptomyces sp. PR69]|uniref:AAA family ATPase n=1 Tax=Streptomyces sp. PR69 TaxID=2984950 RepID=UPI002265193B|nr:AAA family ATPase [Streptomyces sp. PR69]
MQHAVGAPLPPPHGPGHGSAGWAHGARHPGPPPSAPPAPGATGHVPLAPGGPVPMTGPPPSPPTGPPPSPPTGPPPGAPAPASGPAATPPSGPVPVPAPAPASGPAAAPGETIGAGTGTGAATLAVLLIGPAGAGKTTVARHWATSRPVPTAHISLDDVREWVCSGFADPQSGWTDNSEAQYRLARRTCGFAARNFLANGISCILDDAVFPDRPVVGLGGWKRHVGPGLLPVVLLPGLDIVLERNAERAGNRRLSDEEVAGIHGRMAGWYGSGLPIIDNSTYDVETTARALDDVLARAIASPPSW